MNSSELDSTLIQVQQDLINVMQARIKNLEEQNEELKSEIHSLKSQQSTDNNSITLQGFIDELPE